MSVRALTVIAALLLAPATAEGQQPPPSPLTKPADSAAARDPRLDLLRGITLDARQRAQVDSIERVFAAEAERVDARSSSAGETVARLMARGPERQRAIRALLTPEQQVIYDRNLAELRAWMRASRHP